VLELYDEHRAQWFIREKKKVKSTTKKVKILFVKVKSVLKIVAESMLNVATFATLCCFEKVFGSTEF